MSRIGFPLLCLILLIVQSVLCEWEPNNEEKETLCSTAECKARGEKYKKNLNAKVNPCQDFYTFSCGNWHKNHPGPKYAAEWSILQELYVDFFKIIRKTLESYIFKDGDDIKFLQAKLIYEDCVKIPEYPTKDANGIAREVAKVGRLPKTSIWDIHTKYLQLSGESAFFRTKILGHKTMNSVPVLMLLEPHSPYGAIFHEDVWKPEEKKAYTDFLFLIMKSLKLKDSDTTIKERIEKVFKFRENFNRIIRQNKRMRPDVFQPFAGQDLGNWFSETLRQQTNTQKIPWTKVLDALMPNVPPEHRHSRKLIAMRQKGYFLDLMNLLKDTPDEVLANHMEIYFVESHLQLDQQEYNLLERTSIEPHGMKHYIKNKYYPRWHTCIEELNMEETLEELLYQKWFPKDIPDGVRAMSGRIRLAIEDQMKNSIWLDKKTREETASRINNVKDWIGFPPWLYNDHAIRIGRDKDDILTPEASLSPHLNLIYVHAPLLLPPMYSTTMPNVYNYAGMGTTIGHELYHVIDDCGAYEERGRKKLWWTPAMRSRCLRKKALFIDAYDKVTDMDFKNRYNIEVKSDTSISVLENYPDVMGLEAAYKAYKRLISTEKNHCQTLPNFEKYSCDQMFYIAFANAYCGVLTKKAAEKKLKESEHSLDSIRINGAVGQMKSFGRAFGCPIGSPMNPEEKVNLWN